MIAKLTLAQIQKESREIASIIHACADEMEGVEKRTKALALNLEAYLRDAPVHEHKQIKQALRRINMTLSDLSAESRAQRATSAS